MRAIFGAGALAVGLAFAGAAGGAAAPAGLGGARGFEGALQQVQYWDNNYCERLRRRCIYKEERGEVGEGNCRRYREECTGGRSYCQRLRDACIYREERGEVGEGNCRRYRRECQ